MSSQDNCTFKTCEYEGDVRNPRNAVEYKKFATEGTNMPLKKNWSENWVLLRAHYETLMDKVLNMEVRDSDVFVSTFNKSGTTWMQEIAWLLLNNLNYEEAKKASIFDRSPYIEGFVPKPKECFEEYKLFGNPRLFKTHLPVNFMPLQIWKKQAKIIYVARNVKDVIVSSYNFCKDTRLWLGDSLSQYVEDFVNNDINLTPYWSHILNMWFMRHEPNIFFVTYEEMKKDLAAVCQRLSKFLERPPLTKEELETLLDYVSFNNMKGNINDELCRILKTEMPETMDNFKFMRRGVVGSFRDELTPELVARIDSWSAEILSSYGLKEEDIFGNF